MSNRIFNLSSILNGRGGVTLTSSASGFGDNVASAGDFNCDGKNGDVIVCANGGPCYLFFSGYFNDIAEADTLILNGTNGCTLIGPTNSEFGGAIALASNITGNGCSGIMIAAYGISIVYTLFPMRYPPAVYNISNVNASTGLIFVGIPNTALGAALAGDGDVDGDGKTDIALTTSANTPTPSYVVLGRSNFTALAQLGQVNVSAPPAGAYIINIVGPLGLGIGICIAADLNKDGFDDIAISMNGDVNAVALLFGAASLPSLINVSTPNGTNVSLLTSSSSYFGGIIVPAGHVNSNGYEGLLIGSFAETASVLFGQPFFPATFDTSSFNGTNGVNLTSSIGGSFGFSVTKVGYTNSNGLNGFLVGTFSSNSTFFFNGRETWPATVDTSSLNCMTGIELLSSISQAGCVLANIGDFNGDGIPDFVMGSCGTQNVAAIVFGQSFVTCTATPTYSQSDSRSQSAPTRKNTRTPTASLSDTASKSAFVTESPTDTRTVTQSISQLITSTPTATLTSSHTKSESQILTTTQSSSHTKSESDTESPSLDSPTHAASKSKTLTITPFATLSLSSTIAVKASLSPTSTNTESKSKAETSTNTLIPTGSATPVTSRSVSHTESDKPLHTVSQTPTLSLTPSSHSTTSVSHSLSYTDTESNSEAETSTYTRTAPSSATRVISKSFTATTSLSHTETDEVSQSSSKKHTATQSPSRGASKSFSATKSANAVATVSLTPTHSATLTPSLKPTSHRTGSMSHSSSYTGTDTASNSRDSTETHTPTSTRSTTHVASKSFMPTVSVSHTDKASHTASHTLTTSLKASPSITQSVTRLSTTKTQTSSSFGSVSRTLSSTSSKSIEHSPSATSSHTSTRSGSSTAEASKTFSLHSSKSVTQSLTESQTHTTTTSHTLTPSFTPTAFDTRSVTKTSSLSETISLPATRTQTLSRTTLPSRLETSSPYTFPPVLNLLAPNKKLVKFSVSNDAYSTGFFIASLGDINNDNTGDFVLTTIKTNFSAPGTLPICACEAYVIYGQKNISNFQTNLALLKAPFGFSIGNIPGAVKNAIKAPRQYAGYTQTRCVSFGAGLGYINADNVEDFGITNVLANWNSLEGPGSVSVIFGNATDSEGPFYLENLNGHNGFTVVSSPRPIYSLATRKIAGGVGGNFGLSIGSGYITAGDSNMLLIGDAWGTLNLPNSNTGNRTVWAGELNIIPRASSFAAMIDSQAPPLGSCKIPIRTEAFSVCDINGDGIGDIVLGNMQVLGQVVYGRSSFNSSIYNPEFNGNDGFVIVGAPSSSEISIVTGDLDGNGLCDIVIAVPGVNNGSVYTILNKGAFPAEFNVSAAYGQNAFSLYGKQKTLLGKSVALKDINGDGIQDLMVMEQDKACANSTLHVFLGRTNFSVYNSTLGAPDGSEYFMITDIPGCSPTVASADVTGNGMADILISIGMWSDAAVAYLIEW